LTFSPITALVPLLVHIVVYSRWDGPRTTSRRKNPRFMARRAWCRTNRPVLSH